ncbi:MAG: hypothetical protein QM733_01105 [Ilumatobacteraceae bacterium]
MEELAVFVRHPEHAADHSRRQGHGEVLDDIDRLFALHEAVEQIVDDHLDVRLQCGHARRSELPSRHSTQFGVPRRIHEHDGSRLRADPDPDRRKAWALALDADSRSQHGLHIVVPGDQPCV